MASDMKASVAAGGPPLKLVYFAHELTNEGVRRRINEATRANIETLLFGFDLPRNDQGAIEPRPAPSLTIVRLGRRKPFARLRTILRLFGGIAITLGCWRQIRNADVIVARNLDTAALGLLASKLSKSRTKFIYEILDISPQLTNPGRIAILLRLMQSILINFSDIILISSPAFRDEYFLKTYRDLPAFALIENRVSLAEGSALPERVQPPRLDPTQPVWTIGCFGKLRCQKSLQLLAQLARELPGRVKIVVAGYANAFPDEALRAIISGADNIVDLGSYRTPQDLPHLMSQIHLNWCADLRADRANAAWLLPNRIYEGGLFGVPALGFAGNQTGKCIAERKLGYVLPEASYEVLKSFILALTVADYQRVRDEVQTLPQSLFVDQGEFPELLRRAASHSLWARGELADMRP